MSSGNKNGAASAICEAIAVKLMQDENFQTEIMGMIDVDEAE